MICSCNSSLASRKAGAATVKGAVYPRTDRILNLYGLFKAYPISFELVLGDGIGNADAVNAARAFPNVHVGGMWWYNFRVSNYQQTMQQRFEALPSTKSELVV